MNTIKIINTSFSGEEGRLRSRIINNAPASMVPRKGDEIDVGYKPFPVVQRVIWNYDTMIVLVEVK